MPHIRLPPARQSASECSAARSIMNVQWYACSHMRIAEEQGQRASRPILRFARHSQRAYASHATPKILHADHDDKIRVPRRRHAPSNTLPHHVATRR